MTKARALSNPEMAAHLSFVDMGGHCYATVRVDATSMATDSVCIPRPIARSRGVDGGPLRFASATRYRSGAQANGQYYGRRLWKAMPDWPCDAPAAIYTQTKCLSGSPAMSLAGPRVT